MFANGSGPKRFFEGVVKPAADFFSDSSPLKKIYKKRREKN
jgi:hypothetical protein